MHQWLERKFAFTDKPRKLKLKSEPRAFRGGSAYPDPASLSKFKPPSAIVQYRGLAMVFGALLLALAVYFIKSVRAARPVPQPVQSVYIEMVVPNGQSNGTPNAPPRKPSGPPSGPPAH